LKTEARPARSGFFLSLPELAAARFCSSWGVAALGLLEDAVEHGEDGLLLGFGEAAQALELALELGGGPALAGVGAGDAEEDVGGDAEEGGELGDEDHGEAEAADFVVGEGLLGDAKVGGHGLLGEAGLLAELGQAAAQVGDELAIGRGHDGGAPRDGCGLHDRGGFRQRS
jgi:hypothetical protein